ncbi:MAG TPA: hypothetical protein VG711_04405 [Phycisphaerales bacterium]|nr:hypothetical protein [Phycisphaerales bacterium]
MHEPNATCLDCRHPLDLSGSNFCPECGREYDPKDATTFNRILNDPEELVRLPIAQASILRMRLEDAGIPTAQEEQTGGVIMYSPIPMAALHVDKVNLEAAKKLMNEHVEEEATQDLGEWTCPKCGEHIEGTFDVCWNCGSDRPGPGSFAE